MVKVKDEMMTENIYAQLLQGYGFVGKPLRDMLVVVKTEEDYESFQNFVILNEGKIKSRLHLAYLFRLHTIETVRNMTFLEFFEMFNNKRMFSPKISALEELSKEHISIEKVSKVARLMESGVSLENIYEAIVKHRKQHSIKTIINLLSS